MSSPAERTPEWYAARRAGVTSTDLPAILGVSRWASEGDVAREKLGEELPSDPEQERRFRLGRALQEVIRAEDEIEHGVKLRAVHQLLTSREVPWALTSLDYVRVGERTIVEAKSSGGSEFNDGLPERVEAQVRWQMGVAGYPRAHVAVLRYGSRLTCFDLDHDDFVWRNLLKIAADFRARLAAGGPFDETVESGRRAWPLDDGSTILAEDDPELAGWVRDLLATKRNIAQAELREEALRGYIQTRMGPTTTFRAPGALVTWKRTADKTVTNWQGLAAGLLTERPEEERTTLIALHSGIQEGTRRFWARETRGEDER